MSFATRQSCRSSASFAVKKWWPFSFYFDCRSFSLYIYCIWQDATSRLLLFHFHKRIVCMRGGYIDQYVEASEIWRPKALAYLAYAYSKYGTVGVVMCFLDMLLHLLMLRKNKYLLQHQGVFWDIGYPSDLDSSVTKTSSFILILTKQ